MRYNSINLPPGVRAKMNPEDRKELGVSTDAESARKFAEGQERELHKKFEDWLRMKELPYIHSRMDKKPTIREGWPDFTVFWVGSVGSKPAAFIEFKCGNNTLSDDQKQCRRDLNGAGFTVLVTGDLGAAIQHTINTLGLT